MSVKETDISTHNLIKYNGNIPLEGNQLFEEIGFKVVILLILYFPFQILEELKNTFLKCLVYFSPRRIIKDKDIISSVLKNGFYYGPNYFSETEIEFIADQLERVRLSQDEIYKESKNGVFKKTENFRKYREKEMQNVGFLSHICSSTKFSIINFFVTLRIRLISFPRYTITNYLEDQKVDQQNIPAKHLHFDSWRHELKVLIPLNDINEENGPTIFLPKSGSLHFKYFKQYFVSWLQVRGFIKTNKTDMIKLSDFNQKKPVKFTAKKRDIFIFDSRFLHCASNIYAGERKVLWLYF